MGATNLKCKKCKAPIIKLNNFLFCTNHNCYYYSNAAHHPQGVS